MSVSCDRRIKQRLVIAVKKIFFQIKMKKSDTTVIVGEDLFFSNHLPFETKMKKLETICK